MNAKCPYCGKEVEINRDDGRGCEEDVLHQQECRECEKTFVFNTSYIVTYDTYKADCLNGSEHRFKPMMTIPREYSRMRCVDCEEERELTDEERKEIL